MTSFFFEVYGTVKGQGRPKVDFNRRRVYKARQDKEWERSIKEAYINGNGPHFGSRPVSIYVTVYRELPKSKPKRVTREADTHKPDASNILKSIEDALNGIAYDDDCQVVDAHIRKMPRTRDSMTEHIAVTIEEVCE